MIGEIRDYETAQMAIQAALTGHLVISTLHTNDAPAAITRLLELGVPYYLLRNTIVAVLAQRLVRTLCAECSTPMPVDQDAWNGLVEPVNLDAPSEIRVNTGCKVCRDTGYKGRVGIYEVMQMTESLKAQIKTDMDIAEFRKQAIQDGMEPLRVSGARKVASGQTTVAEVLRVAPPPMG